MSNITNAEEIYTKEELDDMPHCIECQGYFESARDVDEYTELCEDCQGVK